MRHLVMFLTSLIEVRGFNGCLFFLWQTKLNDKERSSLLECLGSLQSNVQKNTQNLCSVKLDSVEAKMTHFACAPCSCVALISFHSYILFMLFLVSRRPYRVKSFAHFVLLAVKQKRSHDATLCDSHS